jgi:division protein CdvB (Snf7/Vps24/ESCRT-III family)
LSEKFSKKWGEKEEHQAPFGTKVKEALHPAAPLKPRLDYAVKRIEAQIQRMYQTSDRFSERDKSMFAKVVEAYSKHDLFWVPSPSISSSLGLAFGFWVKS